MPLKSLLLGAAGVLAFGGVAHANGWYVSAEAGASVVDDAGVRFETDPGTFSYDLTGRFDTGWAVMAAVGYSLQSWRIEWEAGWRSNDKNQFTAIPVSTGALDEATLMFNMAYSWPIAQGLDFSLGGGAGLDYAILDIVNVDDSDLNFAYQGIVSLDYALSPSTELTLGYRYLHVLDPEFD